MNCLPQIPDGSTNPDFTLAFSDYGNSLVEFYRNELKIRTNKNKTLKLKVPTNSRYAWELKSRNYVIGL